MLFQRVLHLNGSIFVDELSGRFMMVELFAAHYAIPFNESVSEGTFKH